MQTRPFLIIPACVSECSRSRGGGLGTSENKPTIEISNNTYFCCFSLSLVPFSHSCFFLLATVPASPDLPQSTWSAVLCSHPHRRGWSSMDRPGESLPGWSWDVGFVAEGEGQAVSGTGAHCIWGEVYFTQNERFIPTLPYRSKACKDQKHTPLMPRTLVFPCNNSLIEGGRVVSPSVMDPFGCFEHVIRWPLFVSFTWCIEKDVFMTFFLLFVLTTASRTGAWM